MIDRGETSGLAALHVGNALISAGHAESVLVIGLGLCSVVPPGASAVGRPYGMPWGSAVAVRGGAAAIGRFVGRDGLLPAPRLAEQAALQAGIDRNDLETVAEDSLRRRLSTAGGNTAIVAVEPRYGRRGRSRASIGGVATSISAESPTGRADVVIADVIREYSDVEQLPPVFDDDGLLTAATFAPPADAVAAVLLRRKLSVSVSMPGMGNALHSVEISGIGGSAGDPADPTGGVARAAELALEEAHVGIGDMRQVVSTEPDAATVLLLARAIGIEPGLINPTGGALATGNAGAAEELRLITDGLTSAHIGPMAMNRRYDDSDHLKSCTHTSHRRFEASAVSDGYLLAMSAGPVGSVAVVLRLLV